MPRVSIGLPVYNGENYLNDSIRSLVRQTYDDLELIISDNASTDRTQEICQDWANTDHRVRYFRQQRNQGLARNSNFVFHVSRGELFKWASHDDIHGLTFVERCVEALDANRDAVLACPRSVLIDADGGAITILKDERGHYWLPPGGQRSPIRPADPPRRLSSPLPWRRYRDILLRTNWDIEIYGLVRARYLSRTSLHGLYHGTDKRILAELSLMGRFVEIPEVLFYYRQHPVQAHLYEASGVVRDLYLSAGQRRGSVIPRWNNFKGFCTAPLRAGLGALESTLCLAATATWALRINRWPALLREAGHNLVDAARLRRLQGSLNRGV
ncbi:MAG: glycosyltransferase family 2 protein [Bryobacteraceae bacterium]|nr:glycosyltransferase family 2 protein [Bryobacteraceae bacterium]